MKLNSFKVALGEILIVVISPFLLSNPEGHSKGFQTYFWLFCNFSFSFSSDRPQSSLNLILGDEFVIGIRNWTIDKKIRM